MTPPANTRPAPRRKRSDAERSITSILDAADEILAENPGASMVEVATHAGVTRQTVYAHFPSRDSLLDAVHRRAVQATVAAIDTAAIDKGPPAAALDRLIDAGWQRLARQSGMPAAFEVLDPPALFELHQPILDRLEQLVKRGQSSGDFDAERPVGWLLAAFLGLAHTAAGELASGRMDEGQAATELRLSVHRIFAVKPG